MTEHSCAPDELTWIRSARIGSPESLRDLLDILRQARDFLQVLDPIAQGLSTVAEIEIRLTEIFQILSTPRALGLVLSELLMEFLKQYLTDGVYFIQHGNTRELFERTGTAQFIEGMENYIREADLQGLAAREGELSSFVQFGPEADPQQGAFQSYRRYPEIIQGQLDARRREAVRSALDAFQDTEFNAFNDWLAPILAAFYDPGDPNKPVVFDQDKIGGFLFAIQGEDPIEVYDSFLRLKTVFEEVTTEHLDFSDIVEDLDKNLGLDTIEHWNLQDSLQWNGVNSPLRPFIMPRYSSSPDFERLSSAEVLPFLGNFLLDMKNLVEFAGLPYPENFSLLTIAERLAEKIRKYLEMFDRTVDFLTRVADIMDLAQVWRLHIEPEAGGLDHLVNRIETAKRDDTVRITWGTIHAGVNDDGSPSLTEYRYGRITALPTDTTGIPSYSGQQVNDWMKRSELLQLDDEFAAAGRDGFNYSDPRVYRAGETIRKSYAEGIQAAFPSLSFGPPGNLLIYGVGIFFVEGALSRLFANLFAPTEEDWQEYLCDGPEAQVPIDAVTEGVSDFASLPPDNAIDRDGTVGETGVDTPVDNADSDTSVNAGLDLGTPADANVIIDAIVPPERLLRRLDRYGSSRSIEPDYRAIVSVPPAQARNAWITEKYPLLGGATLPLGDDGSTWTTTRMVASGVRSNIPHSDVQISRQIALYSELPTENYKIEASGSPSQPTDTFVGGTILPGGCAIDSLSLWTILDGLGFPAVLLNEKYYIDVGVPWFDGSLRYIRTSPTMIDPSPGSTVYVYPALPSAPLVTLGGIVTGAVFVDEEPCLTIQPSSPAPETSVIAQSCPGVSFDLAASWKKNATTRLSVIDAAMPCGLQAISAGHVIDVNNDEWGSYQSIDVVTGTNARELDITSGSISGDSQVRDVSQMQEFPNLDLRIEGVLSSGNTALAKDVQSLTELGQTINANGSATLYSMERDGAVYTPPTESTPINNLWRVLSCVAPSLVRIGIGPVSTSPVTVYARPSSWRHLLIRNADGSMTQLDLSVLDGGLPDDVLGETGLLPNKSWQVVVDSATDSSYGGLDAYLVINSQFSSYVSDEVSYDRHRPYAQFNPFIRTSLGDEDIWEDGDHLILSGRPWARAGIGSAGMSVFGGCDPVDSGSIWYETLPKTSRMSLRPSADLRGGGVALEYITARPTYEFKIGTYVMLLGGSHRVVLTLTSTQQQFALEEKNILTGTWYERTTISANHSESGVHVGIVVDVVPAQNRLSLMLSTKQAGVWSQQALSTVTINSGDANPTVRTLEGLKEAGGAWRIGKPSWRDSVLTQDVRLPWDGADGQLASVPACGYIGLIYKALSVDEPDQLLDLYR